MREMLVDTCEEEGLSFDYYILIDQMEVPEGLVCESYGVKIAATDGSEAAEIPNITVSASRIDTLIELLRRNFVTPSTLRDVVLDWL